MSVFVENPGKVFLFLFYKGFSTKTDIQRPFLKIIKKKSVLMIVLIMVNVMYITIPIKIRN